MFGLFKKKPKHPQMPSFWRTAGRVADSLNQNGRQVTAIYLINGGVQIVSEPLDRSNNTNAGE